MRKNGAALRCEDIEAGPARKPWRVEDSIFGRKPRENDSRAYWDADRLALDAFDADWATCCKKTRFERLVEKHATRAAAGAGGCVVGASSAAAASLSAAVEAVKAALRGRYRHVLSVFSHYASVGAGDPFSMQSNEWAELMAFVADEDSTCCKPQDCDRVL